MKPNSILELEELAVHVSADAQTTARIEKHCDLVPVVLVSGSRAGAT